MSTTTHAVARNAPLQGLRVIDLTRLLPGPFATLHLCRLGAEVIKVEDPGAGDYAREMLRSAAQAQAGEPGTFFTLLNEGKQFRRLDLTDAAQRKALLDLAATADLMVEGFRPGVMQRLGLGWDTLHEANPRMVLCSISGYGQSGPYALRAGHDINYIGYAGVLEQIAGRDGALALPNFQIGDLFGGTQAALVAILAALFEAARTGAGRHVDVSMTHAVHEHNLLARVSVANTGCAPAPGRDLLTGGVPCYAPYRTRDARWMAVGALELKFWQRFCTCVGRPDWAARHWSLGQAVGGDDAMALRAELDALFAGRTQAEWVALLDDADCCVTPVLPMQEAMAHPLFKGRNAGDACDQ